MIYQTHSHTDFATNGSTSISTNEYSTGDISISPYTTCPDNTLYVSDSTGNFSISSNPGALYVRCETLDIIADEEIYILKIVDKDLYLHIKETNEFVTAGQTEILEYLKSRVTQNQFLFVQRFIFDKMT